MTKDTVHDLTATLLAKQIYDAVQVRSNDSERSMQSKDYRLGVSDLGTCREQTRRIVMQEEPDNDRDVLEAAWGTALGDYVEDAVCALYPEARRQVAVSVELPSGHRIPGHVDLVFPHMIIDIKTTAALEIVRRKGADQQQRFQRHLYCLGAHQKGLLGVPVESARVANVWVDRSATTKEFHVEQERFSWDVVREADEWLADVLYAVRNAEEASRDKPRDWCYKACPFAFSCRGGDTDVAGLIEDDEHLVAVDLWNEGKELEDAGKRMRAQAKRSLLGVAGSTGTHLVRWVHTDGYVVAEHYREGSERLDVKPLKS
jgi:PD-(D/E)XK nuclease superfamily